MTNKNVKPICPPTPENESKRQDFLSGLRLNLSLPHDEIQGLCETAAEIAGVPIAIVTLIDGTQQKFLASTGLGDLRQTTRSDSFCAHAIMSSQPLEINDASLDVRFSTNPFVINDPNVRSYYGTILEPEPEMRLGTLCILDSEPRVHSDAVKVALSNLSKAITALIVSHREKLELIDYSDELQFKNKEMQDLTALLQNSKTKLLAAEKARSEFVSTISHELRTPLTSINGALSLLTVGDVRTSPQKTDRLMSIASENGERLLSLVNDLLQLQKNDFGTSDADFAPVDLNELIQRSANAYQNYAAEKDVTIIVTPSINGPCFIFGDKNHLDRVMANIISNAFKFSHQGGRIEIDLSCLADGPQISVKDYGMGIPAGASELVFGMFKQVDSSDTRTAKGTGLGMHICRQILTQHDATITYESALGVGTTFKVNFKNTSLV